MGLLNRTKHEDPTAPFAPAQGRDLLVAYYEGRGASGTRFVALFGRPGIKGLSRASGQIGAGSSMGGRSYRGCTVGVDEEGLLSSATVEKHFESDSGIRYELRGVVTPNGPKGEVPPAFDVSTPIGANNAGRVWRLGCEISRRPKVARAKDHGIPDLYDARPADLRENPDLLVDYRRIDEPTNVTGSPEWRAEMNRALEWAATAGDGLVKGDDVAMLAGQIEYEKRVFGSSDEIVDFLVARSSRNEATAEAEGGVSWASLPPGPLLLAIERESRKIGREWRSVLYPKTPWSGNWPAAGSDSENEIGAQSGRLLEEMRRVWRDDPVHLGGRSFWQHLYGMTTLLVGGGEYAKIAELECAHLLAELAGNELVNLRPDKRGSDPGFDGFFFGPLPVLSVGDGETYCGLEVKTTVGEDLALLRKMTDAKERRVDYIQKSLERARKGLMTTPAGADFFRRFDSGQINPNAIATLLVARVYTPARTIEIDPEAQEIIKRLFSHVIVFNIYGELIEGACKGVKTDLISAAAGRYFDRRSHAWVEEIYADSGVLPDALLSELEAKESGA